MAGSNSTTIEQLVVMHTNELEHARKESGDVEVLRREMMALREAHAKAIEQVEDESRRRSLEVEETYKLRIEAINQESESSRQNYEEQINNFRAKYEETLATSQQAGGAELETLKEQMELSMKAKFDEQLQKVHEQHEKAIEDLKEEYEEKITAASNGESPQRGQSGMEVADLKEMLEVALKQRKEADERAAVSLERFNISGFKF